MKIRPMDERDLEKGFLETLKNLTEVKELTKEKVLQICRRNLIADHRVLVMENDTTGQVIGTATLVITWKFTRGGVASGRISDVATRQGFENQGIATKLVDALIEYAKVKGCYKITLQCDPKNVAFYKRHGFREHEVAMRLNIPQSKG